jgi:hypothetical protein
VFEVPLLVFAIAYVLYVLYVCVWVECMWNGKTSASRRVYTEESRVDGPDALVQGGSQSG